MKNLRAIIKALREQGKLVPEGGTGLQMLGPNDPIKPIPTPDEEELPQDPRMRQHMQEKRRGIKVRWT